MKWTNSKNTSAKTQSTKAATAREQLVSKTVMDDVLSQISGGTTLSACHPKGQ